MVQLVRLQLLGSNGTSSAIDHHTGFYQPGGNQGKAVAISCSGETIASFYYNDQSGIQFFSRF